MSEGPSILYSRSDRADFNLLMISWSFAGTEQLVKIPIKHERKILKQVLLIPEVVNIDEGKLLLLKNKKNIGELGFDIEDYGENSIIVREIPAILGKININNLF